MWTPDATSFTDSLDAWPVLRLEEWADTYTTLHMWTEIVGKVRLELTPPINHFWHCALYLTTRGLTTSPIPYDSGFFEIRFDFVDHALTIDVSGGDARRIPLRPRSVREFYEDVMATLRAYGVRVAINTTPDEVEEPDRVPFPDNTEDASYDRDAVGRWFRALASAHVVLSEFRGRFLGKCSPVHFWWGSFDLAVTRFSGKRVPSTSHSRMVREAYSHECSSVGFWPGRGGYDEAAFYSYTSPQPEGFGQAPIGPQGAFYHEGNGQFLLPYEIIRRAPSPRKALLEFAQRAYEAGANLAHWDRDALERPAASGD